MDSGLLITQALVLDISMACMELVIKPLEGIINDMF